MPCCATSCTLQSLLQQPQLDFTINLAILSTDNKLLFHNFTLFSIKYTTFFQFFISWLSDQLQSILPGLVSGYWIYNCMDSFICLAREDWQDTANYLGFFSMGAAIDVYPRYNMSLAALFWEFLNYRMSVWRHLPFCHLGSCWVLIQHTAPLLFLDWKL